MTIEQHQKIKRTTLKEEAKSLVVVAFIAIMIRTLIMEPFFIPSGSMRDTLREGDYVFATKYSYGYSKHSFLFFTPEFMKGRILESLPERGDIVIFRPPHKMETRYIKRLIGLPGDKIQMISGILYINDKPIEREFVGKVINENRYEYKRYLEVLPNGIKYYAQYAISKTYNGLGDDTPAFNVPEGQYFFMGDNRNESGDSRMDLGFVPFENFIAKAQFIFFSAKEWLWLGSGDLGDQISQLPKWILSMRLGRFFKNVYNLD
jgi:signal peptidase I